MTLLKTQSDNVDERGVPYTDYYLGWRNNEGVNVVRVRHVFGYERYKLDTLAVAVPKGESLAKYVD